MTAASVQDWTTRGNVIRVLGTNAPEDNDDLGQVLLDDAIDAATEILYALSGRKFPGIQTETVRPTSRPAQIPPDTYARYLTRGGFAAGWVLGWGWGTCRGCGFSGCCGPYMIGLGRSPIVNVQEVQIDGNVLDPSEYRIDDGMWLVRQDCSGWPVCQDLSMPIGEPCTFSVTFDFGEEPPVAGLNAVNILAAELYKSTQPGMDCKLPQRITNISRQGVSFTVLDPQNFLDKGMTGLYQVDMFIKAFNPNRQIRKPMVYSPDVVNIARRETWPGNA